MSDEMNMPEFATMRIAGSGSWLERREHRRHDLEAQAIGVDRFDPRGGKRLGQLVDISAGGVRLRTSEGAVRPDQQIRVRLELPNFAGISPFVSRDAAQQLKPRREWVGWMTVTRVIPAGRGQVDVAGRLVDMDEIDRGMLSLYLSTQPLAA